MTTLPMPRSMVQGAIATAAVLAGLSGEPALAQVTTAATPAIPGMRMKMESFDRDPGWLGVNNRLAQTREPIQIAASNSVKFTVGSDFKKRVNS